jgi:type III pantothenate kinase
MPLATLSLFICQRQNVITAANRQSDNNYLLLTVTSYERSIKKVRSISFETVRTGKLTNLNQFGLDSEGQVLMTLTLDVGSSRLFGGIINRGEVCALFHKLTHSGLTADDLGIFLIQWMEIKGFSRDDVDAVVFCSVVPELNGVIEQCASDYFNTEALTLRAGVKSGLKVKYTNHRELGADLIANGAGAVSLYPGKNLIIVDFGTATSLCGVSKDREYLGGCLIPGLSITMEALANNTARLPVVEIKPVNKVCSRDTVSGIQGGLYFGTLGMLKELLSRMGRECFAEENYAVIATGQHAELFEKFHLFDQIVPELVLLGLEEILKLN